MPTQLDTRTLVTVAVVVALSPGVIGALVWKTKKTYPGRWALGNLLEALCLILLSLRGSVPDWISIVVANAAALGSGIAFLQGIRQFRGLRARWWLECLVAATGLAAVIWFRYRTDDISARILAMGLALGSLALACGFTLCKDMPRGRRLGLPVTGVIFIVGGVVHFVRGIYVSAFAPVTNLFDPSGSNALFFLAASLGIVSRSVGFFVLVAERLAENSAEISAHPADAVTRLQENVADWEVRQQLRRIVESEVFRRSAQMERFLTLAVERKLLGRIEELKEYALGRDVFNRSEDYDPRMDSIVRVEAQRLRRKLREYYQSHSGDRVLMTLPPGSYVPVFEYRYPADASESALERPVRSLF